MANPTKTKTIIYARVSSKEQEETGYSLPAQEKFLREYSEKRELKIEKAFAISESASGKKQREEFIKMMNYVKKSGIKIIICEKVDRLTRNFKDAVMIDEWLEEDEERQVHLVKDSLVLHKNSRSQEKLNWGIRILFAKNYIDNLSEEVKKGQKEKIAQGWLPTKPPLGYKTIGEKGHKTHQVDEQKALVIRRMFELYASGNYSTYNLVKVMYREGLRNREGKKVGKSRMYDLLSDPFYYGNIRWKNQIFHGQHEPIITKELFDIVQGKLNRKFSQPQHKIHLPVFKAKIMCAECGGVVTWETQKGHWYGHCNGYMKLGQKKPCSQKGYMRQEKAEEQLFPFFDNVAPKGENVLRVLEKALKEDHSEEISRTTIQRDELNSNFERVQRRLDAIYDDKIDGKITREFYEKKFEEFSKQKEEILYELGKLNTGNQKYYEAGYAVHELASQAMNIYQSEKATTEERRLLLSYVFSNISKKEDEIKPNYTLAFDFLSNWVPKLNSTFEPQKRQAKSGEYACVGSKYQPLLRVVDAVRTHYQGNSEYFFIPQLTAETIHIG